MKHYATPWRLPFLANRQDIRRSHQPRSDTSHACAIQDWILAGHILHLGTGNTKLNSVDTSILLYFTLAVACSTAVVYILLMHAVYLRDVEVLLKST